MAEPRFSRRLIQTGDLSDHVLAKWATEVLREGFTPFPKTLIRAAPRIFARAEGVSLLCAVLAIVDFRKPGAMWSAPTLDYLAFTAGVAPAEFRHSLERLEELGLISVRVLENLDEPRLAIDLKPLFERIKNESRDDG